MEEKLNNLFNLGTEQQWHYLGQISDFFGATLPILAILLGLWKRKEIRDFFSGISFTEVGEMLHETEKFDAVIFTVSREEGPKTTIEATSPKVIGLLPTHDTSQIAEKIKHYAEERGIAVLETSIIDDPYNPAHCQKAAKHLLRLLQNTSAKKIAVDVTGGTTPMSIGAFMAAHEAGVATIYLKSDYDGKSKKIKPGTTRLGHISAA